MYRKKGVLIINSKRRIKEIEILSDKEGYNVNYSRSLPPQQDKFQNYQLVTLYLDNRVIKDLEKYRSTFQNCKKTLVLVDSNDKVILNAACKLDPDNILAIELPDHFISQKISEMLRTPAYIKNGVIMRSFVTLNIMDRKLRIRQHEISLTTVESKILETLMTKNYYSSKNELISAVNITGTSLNEKYLSVIIHRLKKKLKNITGFEIVYSKRGLGYYFSL